MTNEEEKKTRRRSALRGAPRVLKKNGVSTGLHFDDDWNNEQEDKEARKRHQQIQWIKSLEPGQVPDALVGDVVGIKEGVIRLEEMLTLHFDDAEEPDEVTELLYRERGQQWRNYGEERRAIVKMGDALDAAIREFMAKLGKTDKDIIEDLRAGACKQCDDKDECLGECGDMA